MWEGCSQKCQKQSDQIKVCKDNLPVSGNVVNGERVHFIYAPLLAAGLVLLDLTLSHFYEHALFLGLSFYLPSFL